MKGLLLSFILLFWGTFSVNAQNRSIRFLDDNWNIVLKKAERTGKLIFVDCYTSWCGPCQTLAKEVFTLDSVADFFNRHFLCVKLDIEKGKGLECGVTEDLILAHRMDTLFPHEDIRFDSMHGIYSPEVKGGKSIYLSVSDEILRHWAQNAMNRNGFLCLELPEADRKECLPLLEVKSANHLILSTERNSEVYCSFEALFASSQLVCEL